MRALSIWMIFTFLFGIAIVSSHKEAKVKLDRVHEGQDDLRPGEHKFHIRHSGLEGYAKDEHREAQNVLHNEEFIRNKEHLKEHARGEMDLDIENATAEELDMYFFKQHDTDNNNFIDGLEILSAMLHGLEEEFEDIEDDEGFTEVERQEETELLKRKIYGDVDKVLLDDDKNRDGYISYPEYLMSRHANINTKQDL